MLTAVTMRFQRLRGIMVVPLLVLALSLPRASQADLDYRSASVQQVDAGQVVSLIADSLTAGRESVAAKLHALGYRDAGPWMSGRTDGQYNPAAFSGHSLIRQAYLSAEAGATGDGNRLLGALRADAVRRSAAAATDPGLTFLSGYTDAELRKPFNFALVESAVVPALTERITPAVDTAIELLATHLSNGNLGHFRLFAMRHLRKAGFTVEEYDRILRESSSFKDAIVRMFRAGLPPPTAQRASLGLLQELAARSAAFTMEPAVARAIDNLNTELPPELDRYTSVEDDLESRQSQVAEAQRAHGEGKIRKPTDNTILALLARPQAPGGGQNGPGEPPPHPSGGSPGDTGPRRPSDSGGAAAVAGSGGPKPPGPGTEGGHGPGVPPVGPSTPPGPTGSGPTGTFGAPTAGGPSPAAKNYSDYVERSFESRGRSPRMQAEGPPPVPRSYRLAIRSARAARGVAAGAEVHSNISGHPLRLYWVPNEKDARFGQMILLMEDDGWTARSLAAVLGRKPAQRTLVSRVIFEDSFLAAVAALWGDHGEQARFRDGEILVLMSMDPDSPISREPIEKLRTEFEAKRAALRARIVNGKINEQSLNEMLDLFIQYQSQARDIPRGVVVHPALEGRELAWSAIRVDFTFNVLDRLEREAMKINGGHSMPEEFKRLGAGRASTWQFYERPSYLHAVKTTDNTEQLVVSNSKDASGAGPRENHFSISMFTMEEPPIDVPSEQVEEGVYRLPVLEQQEQPLLDWLFTYHPDYWRLNDFSEALSVLRWVKQGGAGISVLSMNGETPRLVTPDRILHGKAEPRVGPGAH